ncbi:MAG: type II toxin-antitoxin system Phd/YefM family antitoxin [Myxococcales bacterium]|nr:type II toxin-antitoxin system Phd/YefM family antitoxin [Myxococcales bacterium]MDP3498919.1 type II toxin-antitoxin system Phd/YefM family antitoxin [Myxococcales bacterium]
MNWSVSEAKARLSEVLARARKSPQVIENRGESVAVIISKQEFDRLSQLGAEPRPSAMAELLEFTQKLKARGALEFELPRRELEPERAMPFLDDED